jgi:phosphoglycerol transferase MdoB-like AlkP superfamily enzyme
MLVVISLTAAKRLNIWIAFLITVLILIYLLFFVIGGCLSYWWLFILGIVALILALLLSRQAKK